MNPARRCLTGSLVKGRATPCVHASKTEYPKLQPRDIYGPSELFERTSSILGSTEDASLATSGIYVSTTILLRPHLRENRLANHHLVALYKGRTAQILWVLKNTGTRNRYFRLLLQVDEKACRAYRPESRMFSGHWHWTSQIQIVLTLNPLVIEENLSLLISNSNPNT